MRSLTWSELDRFLARVQERFAGPNPPEHLGTVFGHVTTDREVNGEYVEIEICIKGARDWDYYPSPDPDVVIDDGPGSEFYHQPSPSEDVANQELIAN
ncbi:hypothetical protein GGR58DRAFT_467284 [Xylaria digitata]|nr:hypothetical protein GGR58DRAFT_467284 [Xylaria digitata]